MGETAVSAKLSAFNTTASGSMHGLMMRNSEESNSAMVSLMASSNGYLKLVYRKKKGHKTKVFPLDVEIMSYLKLEYKGNKVHAYASEDGQNWEWLNKVTMPHFNECLFAGIAAWNFGNDEATQTLFEDLQYTEDKPDIPLIQVPMALNATGGVQFNVWPNPASHNVNVSYETPEFHTGTLQLFDLRGTVLLDVNLDDYGSGTYDIDLDALGLSSGTYMIRILAGDQLQTKQITVHKE